MLADPMENDWITWNTDNEFVAFLNSLDGTQKFTPLQAKLYPGGKMVLSFQLKNDRHF